MKSPCPSRDWRSATRDLVSTFSAMMAGGFFVDPVCCAGDWLFGEVGVFWMVFALGLTPVAAFDVGAICKGSEALSDSCLFRLASASIESRFTRLFLSMPPESSSGGGNSFSRGGFVSSSISMSNVG